MDKVIVLCAQLLPLLPPAVAVLLWLRRPRDGKFGKFDLGLRALFADLAMVSSTDVLKGRRFGNVVLAASSWLDVEELRRQIARQPFPAGVRDRRQLMLRYSSYRPWTDADCAPSPEPARDGWRIR